MNIRRTSSVVVTTGLIFTGALGAQAQAQAQVTQDGLVNVNVGNVTILEDVRVGVAANIVAQICGVRIGPVAVLGRAVDRSGDTDTVCRVDGAPIKITQN